MVKNDSFRVFGKVQELFGARFGIEQIKKKIIKHGKFTLEIMKIVIFSLFMVINGFFLRILFFFNKFVLTHFFLGGYIIMRVLSLDIQSKKAFIIYVTFLCKY
jgi:hypothetical protein